MFDAHNNNMKLRTRVDEQGRAGMLPSSMHPDTRKSFSARFSVLVVCSALGGGVKHWREMQSTTGNNNYIITELQIWAGQQRRGTPTTWSFLPEQDFLLLEANGLMEHYLLYSCKNIRMQSTAMGYLCNNLFTNEVSFLYCLSKTHQSLWC